MEPTLVLREVYQQKKIEPIGEITIPTRDTFEEGIPEIIEQIKNITKVPKGIGIGLPGSITKDGQDFDDSTNLQCWVYKPIIDILHKEFGCSVYIENDTVAQAHGEAFFSTERKFYLSCLGNRDWRFTDIL